ncbi:MAG: formate/nitrite transporter family protein [Frankiales bacterium]|jgi:formate/nitrite transporter|nr:formate/nitrite transporter family protein [Frankiales bacterium]
MAIKSPPEISAAAVEVGTAKADLTWDRALVGGFLAGAYIAFGSLVAISVSSGLDPKTWGTLPTLFTGAVFTLGLVLVVVAGAELLTGNMALLPIALLRRRITLAQLGVNWLLVLVGNLAGSLFVAYFLAWKSGVIGPSGAANSAAGLEHTRAVAIAAAKGVTESNTQIFLRAVGCNWLVCLAIWLALAANDVAGKVLGIFFPIMAFVAMGFDHVVANMFFLPLGHYAGTPGLGWSNVANNLWWAFLGNAVGAGLFVAVIYWFLYLRGTPELEPSPMGARHDSPTASEPAVSTRQAR